MKGRSLFIPDDAHYTEFLLQPSKFLISKPTSFWGGMYDSSMQMNATYNSFINFQDIEDTIKFPNNITADSTIISTFVINPVHLSSSNLFVRKTLIQVLSDLGGLYSSIAAGLVVVFAPLLYSSFERSLSGAI